MTALHNLLKKKKQTNGVLLSFLLGMACAFFLFLPFLIVDKGFFLYSGDYNAQQIPFYSYVHNFIKTGGGTWSWATDIGSSVVNSYSFYNIGSPFLWLSLLVPNSWMPYMMVPLFILKFGCIAAAACLYVSRYAKTRNMAVIVSLAYAFSGFNVYNIFFNHMLEPAVIFPLMLWAMDGFVMEKRRGFFAVSVALALLNSYFFFVGNVVFVLLYFFVKVFYGAYRMRPKMFYLLVFEAVLGVGIGMALALPSFFNLIGNPRTDNFANGLNLIMYGKVQQYFAIFASLFLPPDPPYLPNLFTDGLIRWTSMSAFLPIFSVAGVAAYWKAHKKSWLKTLLLISLICAFVPILNSSFYAFNSSYYARWYYMPLLMMALATLLALEDKKADLAFGAKVALVLTAGFGLFGLLPTQEDGEWKIGVEQYAQKFWLTLLLALLSAGLCYVLFTQYKKKIRFAPLLLSAVMGFSAFYPVVHIALGKFPQWQRDSLYAAQTYRAAAEIDLPQGDFYRIDALGGFDNLGLWLNQSCLQTFNSVVTPSIMEFYPMVGVKRDVSSKPSASIYALRGLLSVRYTLVPLNKFEVPVDALGVPREELGIPAEQLTIPYTALPVEFPVEQLQLGWAPDADGDKTVFTSGDGARGWHFWAQQGGYAIFENENYLPLGFAYDEYILMDDLWQANQTDRAGLLVQAIGLEAEQAQQYGHLFGGSVGLYNADGRLETGSFVYNSLSYEQYVADCNERRAVSSYETSADASGFTCKIVLPSENLVFFGVPYDEGFTATVNGVEAEVLKVSGGMMAVLAPAGDNTIVFRYKTPGFGAGLVVSAASLVVLAAYLVLGKRLARRGTPQKPIKSTGAGANTSGPPGKPEDKEEWPLEEELPGRDPPKDSENTTQTNRQGDA